MGNNIKKLRIASKKKQTQVAQELGVKLDRYRSWEQGKRNPPSEMGIRIAEYFGVSTDTVYDSQFAQPIKQSLSVDEEELVELYRALDDNAKTAVLTTARALSGLRVATPMASVSHRVAYVQRKPQLTAPDSEDLDDYI